MKPSCSWVFLDKYKKNIRVIISQVYQKDELEMICELCTIVIEIATKMSEGFLRPVGAELSPRGIDLKGIVLLGIVEIGFNSPNEAKVFCKRIERYMETV